MTVSIAPQKATPAKEATLARDVFLGTVLNFHMDHHGTLAGIRVEKLVRGVGVHPGDVLQVWLGMQLMPNGDFTGGILGLDPFTPATMPGDQAVFLAMPSRIGLSADTYAQVYPVDGGTVTADSASPYGRLVDHVGVDAFLRSLA